MLYIIVLLFGILVYCLVIISFGEKAVRLEHINLRLKKAMESNIREDEPYENIPFIDRIIKPSIDKFIGSISKIVPISEKEQEAISLSLMQAGMRTKPADYTVMKMMIVLLFAFVGIIYATLIKHLPLNQVLLYGFGAASMGYLFLQYTLKRRIRIRQDAMQVQFPNFIDLLSVCVEAGLGFDQAIQYVIKEFPCELSDEFKIVSRDISLGSTRQDALMKLQKRCTVEQLKTFNAAIIQADEMGISLKTILSSQASNVRQAYKQKINEKVQKLPVKILFPIVLFIFPVIFIVLLVPAILSALKTISGVF